MASINQSTIIIEEFKLYKIHELTKQLGILRVKINLTQENLASVLGISRQTYCQIENGNKSMSWNTYLKCTPSQVQF